MGIISGPIRWFGRRVGWIAHKIWEFLTWLAYGIYRIGSKILWYIGLFIVLVIASILAFFGQVILLILTVIGSILILFLKAFGWITYKLLCGTKWFGEKLGEYTEMFFVSVKEAFQKEEREIEQRYYLLMKE